MGGVTTQGKCKKVFIKYRYPALVLLVGVLLMLLPGQKVTQEKQEAVEPVCETMEQRLANILSTVQGAGKVDVLLSVSQGEQIVYQMDLNSDISADRESIDSETVVIKDNQRGDNGLIQQTNPPKYLGAVISCEGAEDPVVRLAIVNAVVAATGLTTDKVCVVKMK